MPLYTSGPYNDAMWAKIAHDEVQYSFRNPAGQKLSNSPFGN
jgi:hypothetical protein